MQLFLSDGTIVRGEVNVNGGRANGDAYAGLSETGLSFSEPACIIRGVTIDYGGPCMVDALSNPLTLGCAALHWDFLMIRRPPSPLDGAASQQLGQDASGLAEAVAALARSQRRPGWHHTPSWKLKS